jgi:hypothetical protein
MAEKEESKPEVFASRSKAGPVLQVVGGLGLMVVGVRTLMGHEHNGMMVLFAVTMIAGYGFQGKLNQRFGKWCAGGSKNDQRCPRGANRLSRAGLYVEVMSCHHQ